MTAVRPLRTDTASTVLTDSETWTSRRSPVGAVRAVSSVTGAKRDARSARRPRLRDEQRFAAIGVTVACNDRARAVPTGPARGSVAPISRRGCLHFSRRGISQRAQRGDEPHLLERLRARFEQRRRADEVGEAASPADRHVEPVAAEQEADVARARPRRSRSPSRRTPPGPPGPGSGRPSRSAQRRAATVRSTRSCAL